MSTKWTRYAGEFPRILADAEARTEWSEDRICEFRDRRLSEFVAHAATTVPFYRDTFGRIEPTSVRGLDDLASLPVLAKAEAQVRRGELASSARLARVRTVHTSGTTGAGFRFGVTLCAVQELWATWWRYVGWHGIRFGTWHALFAGRPIVPAGQAKSPFWRVNLPGRQVVFSGYHMSPYNLTAYLEELRRRRLQWYHGYPSLLTLLAGHLLDTGFDLGHQVKLITTSSESLMQHQKTLIERAFGVKPRQHYALTEMTANMSECERGMLHVDEDLAAVEFLPRAGEDARRIVGTNFSNFATPLVRYDSHDLAVLPAANGCGCGRPGRIVERVDGRKEDYVVLRDGTPIGRMDHLFKDMVNIREAQIHQSRPGEITIRIVRGEGYGRADEEGLLREAERRIGDGASVAIEYVRELPRSPAGKLRLVVSDVPGASISAAAPPDGAG